VDSGKTSLLDAIRGTKVYASEPGFITQHVGASEVPLEVVQKICKPVLARLPIQLAIPGLLFVDTPGHEVFANLRRRGGSIADIAILVVDVTKGIEAQTVESLDILREYKTPFVIAANKIDLLDGWLSEKNASFTESFPKQRRDVQDRLDEKLYSMIGQLYERGFNAERFDRVTDFTKQVLIVPVSAREVEGLPELLMYIAGLAQKYLETRLKVSAEEGGRGSILEVKEERSLGATLDVVLYDGSVKVGDSIVFASASEVIVSKVKALLRPAPLQEMRAPTKPFQNINEAKAAAGVKIACDRAEEALPGSPLLVVPDDKTDEAVEEVRKELKEILVDTAALGVILKADALGSIEAITKLLGSEKVPVRKALVGNVTKRDVGEAASVREKDRSLGIIFAFNAPIEDDARRLAEESGVKIIEEDIIYNLIEGYRRWNSERIAQERREAFSSLTLPAKIKVLPGYCFHASNPAIFGVEVLVGSLRKGYVMMDEKGVEVGSVKSIQREKQSVEEAKAGDQIAISMDEPTYGRQVFEKQVLLSSPRKEEIEKIEKEYSASLSPEELALLKDIKKIKGYTVF
jgi:translation initiation factor 5B